MANKANNNKCNIKCNNKCNNNQCTKVIHKVPRTVFKGKGELKSRWQNQSRKTHQLSNPRNKRNRSKKTHQLSNPKRRKEQRIS